MQLTPEQKDQLQQARTAGERRVHLRLTAEQKDEWQSALAQELACKDENITHVQKIKAAAEQPGFFGDVRRAIALSRRPLTELAREINIDPLLFSDFCADEAELPAAALNQLLETLGLRVMQEIPR